jgi:hypothetical protein
LHCGTSAGDQTEPLHVLHTDSATWILPELADYRLSHTYGQWSAELQLQRGPLAFGETVLGSRRGVTSHHANPWAMLDAGDATEDHGAGVERGARLERKLAAHRPTRPTTASDRRLRRRPRRRELANAAPGEG